MININETFTLIIVLKVWANIDKMHSNNSNESNEQSWHGIASAARHCTTYFTTYYLLL